MSFPILKEKNIYDIFQKKIELFRTEVNKNISKQMVIISSDKDRKMTDEEIKNFSDIYLLPKIYLFYSKILYNFSLNIQKYYNIYNESNNIYKNINQYYLSIENPYIKKVNIVIKNMNINASIKLIIEILPIFTLNLLFNEKIITIKLNIKNKNVIVELFLIINIQVIALWKNETPSEP
jgi:hypothetical protein